MKQKQIGLEIDGEANEFQIVFSDIMSFISGLFILLFTLINQDVNPSNYFEEINVRFSDKFIEQPLNNDRLLLEDINHYIKNEALNQYAMVMVEEDMIRLIFNDPILFKSGTDQLLNTSKEILDNFMNILSKVKNPILIEGHTDDVPMIPNGRIQNNWDLGYFRAAAVANYLIKKGMNDDQLVISSFANTRPLSVEKTEKGRRKNRRIEIKLVRVK